jgi:hypothetical protein
MNENEIKNQIGGTKNSQSSVVLFKRRREGRGTFDD